jgi:hypothetical protein
MRFELKTGRSPGLRLATSVFGPPIQTVDLGVHLVAARGAYIGPQARPRT